MDHTSKNNEILERHKALFKLTTRILQNGIFVDCTKEVLADLQAEDNSESKEVLIEDKTRKIYFQGQKVTVLLENIYQQSLDSQQLKFMNCFVILHGKFRVFNFCALSRI